MASSIVFVPGFWEGPEVFSSVASTLESLGYAVTIAKLVSTGTSSPGNPTFGDDVRGVRQAIEPLVDAEKEVVLVMHSAGGFIGSNAIKGLSVESRGKEGKNGGVRKLVFIAAALFPEEMVIPPMPFYEYDGGKLWCKDAQAVLFSDLPDAEAKSWLARLQHQPASGWEEKVTYGGWKEIPSIFLCAEGDAILPFALQQQMAGMAGSQIGTCSAGHMVMLSQPDKVVEVIKKAAEDRK